MGGRMSNSISDLAVPVDYERIIPYEQPSVDLKAIVCIHNTTLGSATGGTRFYPYNSEREARTDVIRLAAGMTYKAAMLWPDFKVGGGKAVIIGDPDTLKTESMLRAYGKFITRLNGQFFTGEDMGVSVDDIEKMHTPYALGRSEANGGCGNPADMTALGCLQGIRAALQFKYGSDQLHNRRIIIMGAGNVGFRLARIAKENGAYVLISEPKKNLLDRVISELRLSSKQLIEPEEIYDVEGDVFAPCAHGGILNNQTIPRIQCPIVAGSANNVLANPEKHSYMLHNREILYAPDFVINAGGLVKICCELDKGGYSDDKARRKTIKIYERMMEIFRLAQEFNVSPDVVANAAARNRIKAIKKEKSLHITENDLTHSYDAIMDEQFVFV
jgi:leucine dehydrogenase